MNQKENIINMQNAFDKKAKEMQERNKYIIGEKFTQMMEMLDSSNNEEGN